MSDQPRRADGTYAPGHTISDEQREKMKAGQAAKRPEKINAIARDYLIACDVDPDEASALLFDLARKAARGSASDMTLFLRQTRQLVRDPKVSKVTDKAPVIHLSTEASLALLALGVGLSCGKCGGTITVDKKDRARVEALARQYDIDRYRLNPSAGE